MNPQFSAGVPADVDDRPFYDLVRNLIARLHGPDQVPAGVAGGLTVDHIRTLSEGLDRALAGESASDAFLRFIARGGRTVPDAADEQLSEAEVAAVRDRGVGAASVATLVAACTIPDRFVDLLSAADLAPYWEDRRRALFETVVRRGEQGALGSPTLPQALAEADGLPPTERPASRGELARWVKTRVHGHAALPPEEMKAFLLALGLELLRRPRPVPTAEAVNAWSNVLLGVTHSTWFSSLETTSNSPYSIERVVELLLEVDPRAGELLLMSEYAGQTAEAIAWATGLDVAVVVRELNAGFKSILGSLTPSGRFLTEVVSTG